MRWRSASTNSYELGEKQRMAGDLARMWHGTLRQVQTTRKALVYDLGLRRGAGDENRTRALSLGILRRLPAAGAVTCMDTGQCPLALLSGLPLLTVVVRRGWCGGGATWCAFLREGKRLRRPRPTRGVFATGLQHPGVLQPPCNRTPRTGSILAVRAATAGHSPKRTVGQLGRP